MRYQIVAEAYRDLEAATARLELIDRLAALIAETPKTLLPTVTLLCQGEIAPDFAGVELGLAERMAARAVAEAAGVTAEQALASAKEVGDLGLAAEALLAALAPRPATLEVEVVFGTLHQIAQAEGTGSQARKLAPFVGLLREATPLEARYLVRTVTGSLRLGIGTATILDALAEVHAGGRKARPVLERAYNICSDLGLVAATLVQEGLEAVEGMRVRAGNPVRPMLAQRMSSSAEILAKLGGACAAEYKYDGIRVQAHRTADGQLELFTRRLERVSGQFPDTVKLLQAGLGPREAILEGEVVAFDPASGELRPFQDVMFRRRKYGITEAVSDVPVSLFCFELLYADGDRPHPPALPGAAGAAGRGHHPVAAAPAGHRRAGRRRGGPGGAVRAGGRRRLRGPDLQVPGADRRLPGRRARLVVDQAQARLPQRAQRHPGPGGGGGAVRAGPARRHLRGAAAGRL